jgi:DNA-binding transcriptional MerR regulator
MNETLRIGEVAELLGITTKTIRHYEKLGLIDPDRTESDYRLYTPEDVLRIQRVRHLQSLGLSLKQIKMILSNADDGELWEKVLAALLQQIEADIDVLTERRERIAGLLDEGMPDALTCDIDAIGIPIPAQMYLEQHLSPASREEWLREKRVYAYLGPLPETQRSMARELILGLISEADLYERSLLISSLFGITQEQPELTTAVTPLRWIREVPDPAKKDDDMHFGPPRFKG